MQIRSYTVAERNANDAVSMAQTADGARKWNDANVLALSLRTTSEPVLAEILDAWFSAEPSPDDDDRANVAHINEIGERWP